MLVLLTKPPWLPFWLRARAQALPHALSDLTSSTHITGLGLCPTKRLSALCAHPSGRPTPAACVQEPAPADDPLLYPFQLYALPQI